MKHYTNIHTLGLSWAETCNGKTVKEVENCGWHFVDKFENTRTCSDRWCTIDRGGFKRYKRWGIYVTETIHVYGLLKTEPSKTPPCNKRGWAKKLTSSGKDTADEYSPCFCKPGWTGDDCEEKVRDNPVECDKDFKGLDFLVKMKDVYRVPGMFDLANKIDQLGDRIENKIDEQTEILVKQMLQIEGKIDEQTEMLISEMTSQLGNQTSLLLETTYAVEDKVSATHDAVLHSSAKVITAMQEQNSVMLDKMQGMGKFLKNFMSEAKSEILHKTSVGQNLIMEFIGTTALQTDRKLTALEGAIQASSYFESIALDLPIFLEKFEYAMQSDQEVDRREFSDYLRNNEHDLLKSVRALIFALKGGALSKDDSLINAKMKQLGGDACLPHYHAAIQELREDLIFLHLSITDMKMWNLKYMSKGATIEEHDSYEDEREMILGTVALELAEIAEVTKYAGCRAFNNSQILGGGCMANMTYAGQKVPITCDNQDLFPTVNGTSLVEIVCEPRDGSPAPEWNVPPEFITCGVGCTYLGETYAPGKSVDLPAAKPGHRWLNESGGVEITSITCMENGMWEYNGGIEEDIDECAERPELCKPHGDCNNTVGEFTCICHDHFEIKETLGEDPVCVDIDECTFGGEGDYACLAYLGKGSCRNTGEFNEMISAYILGTCHFLPYVLIKVYVCKLSGKYIRVYWPKRIKFKVNSNVVNVAGRRAT